ncbi:MAG: hypothetical protein U0324_47005 [Polyangiales bacterium]
MFTEWKVTRVAFDAASKLLGLQLRGDGAAGDDDGAVPEDDAQFLGQFGVAVRPIVTATLEALGYQDGDEVRVMKLWDKARSPTDLEAGETRLFSVGNVARVVRLLSGRVVVEAPEIRLGASATKKVNREGDAVDCGTLRFLVAATSIVVTYTPPSGAPQAFTINMAGMATFTAIDATITLTGRTGPGSNKVRAED